MCKLSFKKGFYKMGKGLCGFGFIKRRKVLQLGEGSSKVRVGFVSCIFRFFRGDSVW